MQEQFSGLVRTLTTEQSLIQAIYAVIDDISAAYIRDFSLNVACHKGCGLCCKQMVYCLPQEWEAIRRHVLGMQGMPRHNLEKRMKKSHQRWQHYRRTHTIRTRDNAGIKQIHKFWLGIECPFLNANQECDVYDARPIACRTALQFDSCCSSYEDTARLAQYPWSFWAIDILANELGGKNKAFLIPIPVLVGHLVLETHHAFEYLRPTFLGR